MYHTLTKLLKESCGHCGSKNTSYQLDVGFDIDEEGETYQHLQECDTCYATRLVCHFVPFDTEKIYTGDWDV